MAKTKLKLKKNIPEPKRVEIDAEINQVSGRYANHIQVGVQEEEFVLDFLTRVGDRATLVARVFITPAHARRLADLLERQLKQHKSTYADSPLKTKPRKRKK